MYLGRCTERMTYLGRCTEQVRTVLPEWHTYATVPGTHWAEKRTAAAAPAHNNPLIKNTKKSIHHEDIKPPWMTLHRLPTSGRHGHKRRRYERDRGSSPHVKARALGKREQKRSVPEKGGLRLRG